MDDPFRVFPSRRSVVQSANGIVACSQPLAAQAGLKILRDGGNAADAAVAVAAALNVTEPTSTGIGGDVFCLYYDAATKSIRGLNGSGRSPAALTLSKARSDLSMPAAPAANAPLDGEGGIPMTHVHAVTVPGAAAAWVDVIETFGSGKIGLAGALEEGIRLAEEGAPISLMSSVMWAQEEAHLKVASPNYAEVLKGGTRAPKEGEIVRMPHLAETFRELVRHGKRGFYEGRVAQAIVDVIKGRGGCMELEDLKAHADAGSEIIHPVFMEYGGHRLWECTPNSQGLVALMALGILEKLQKDGVVPDFGKGKECEWKHNSAEYLHVLVEVLRIAFSDGRHWIADPQLGKVPTEGLIDKAYLAERAKLFDPHKRNNKIAHGTPAFQSCDTVYFSVTDKYGNGCSFINSNYGGFGSGIIPYHCGFALQNRGCGFSLHHSHPNALTPRKRPYHTIIPSLITDTSNNLHSVMGVMGGFMQPQGHLQVFLNLLVWGMNPQQAVDAPRISVGKPYDPRVTGVSVEEGVVGEEEVLKGLEGKGHDAMLVRGWYRAIFGRGQVVRCSYDVEDGQEDGGTRVWSAGSDMRGDGHAVGY
ncbi:gamma-glutamyltranspeptidase [Choiromyces venosus 120613-1]|uniref:Gamma-glutamyltranspeptidase n=1 Tax=Choiromyces venosus 120613-1 TaxID=1336337 RepID=A0A3N4JE68_9PEZI|nr:gamma-glutamyltranspeptidase [Choiromyces venosus 120613-1]